MMTFAVRCLHCNNVDEFPRLDYDEIPYCSQCASTANLVPASPPKPQPAWEPDDLSALFSRTLSLHPATVTPPTSPPSANFSVSQHYTHPAAFRPPTPILAPTAPTAAAAPLDTAAQHEREYIQYLLSSNLGSASSSSDLAIARAHGIISDAEYVRAVHANNELVLRRRHAEILAAERDSVAVQQQLFMEMQSHQNYGYQGGGGGMGGVGGGGGGGGRGLEEDCSAHTLLSMSAAQRKDPVFRTAEFFNDYYGGVDSSWEDEEAPCSVPTGGRLRPFDL